MAVAPTLKLPALLRPAHTVGNEFEQSTDSVFVPATPFSRRVCGRLVVLCFSLDQTELGQVVFT